MVALETPICDFGWNAPDFNLLGTDGKNYQFNDIKGAKGTLVMFICNHCPYVKSVIGRIVEDCNLIIEKEIGVIAIMSNDVVNYPDDSFDNMKIFSDKYKFNFPYLYDETQDVAKNYNAVCTPDFFGFDKDLKLQYRGRLDSNGKDPEMGEPELYYAIEEVIAKGYCSSQQSPSMGCSIKWKS